MFEERGKGLMIVSSQLVLLNWLCVCVFLSFITVSHFNSHDCVHLVMCDPPPKKKIIIIINCS